MHLPTYRNFSSQLPHGGWSALLFMMAALFSSMPAEAQEQGRPGSEPSRSAEKQTGASSAFSTVSLTSSMEVLNDSAKLGSGDVVSFRVVEERQDPIQLVVTDSGEMEIPFIGRVMAANKTCKRIAHEIKPLLEKEYFYKATVIIGLNAIGTRSRGKIYITGQVKNQGAMELMPDESLTVSKAILRAGGLADFANKKKVKLIRKKGGAPSDTSYVNLAEILDKGHLEKDPVLQAGDVIVVPERLINF